MRRKGKGKEVPGKRFQLLPSGNREGGREGGRAPCMSCVWCVSCVWCTLCPLLPAQQCLNNA